MRKNLAKHTAKKLPLAKRVLALCFALIFVCSCLLPAFANGTGAELETPDTEVVEAADPGAEPEPMDLYDEPAAVADEPEAMDDDFAVADEPAALDDNFAMDDEPAAMDDQVEKPVVDDEPAAMDDQVEKPVVDDEPAAMDNEVEKPVEGDEPPVADDTPAKEGATKTTTDASGNTVYEYDTSGTTFPDDDAAALPEGDQVLDQMDAAFSIPTNIYHFWLKKMSSYDLADIADDAKTAEMTVEQYLAMYGTEKGCYHIMTAADGANLKDYQFANPTSNDDPEGNSRTFAGWYYTDDLGEEQKFVFDEHLYVSEGTTVEVYAKWTDEEAEEAEEAEETKKDDPVAAQKAKFKQWYQNLMDCTSEYTLKSLAEEYFATEGFYTYLGSLPDEEQEVLWDKLEPVNQPKDDTAEYEEETPDDGIALLSITAPDKVQKIHVGKKLVLTSDLTDYGEWEGDIWNGWHYRNYTAEHEWTSSDPSVATVESGVLYQTEKATVTGVSVGTTTITHTAKGYYVDNSGNKHYGSTRTDTYTIQVVKNNVNLGDDNGARIYILKTPTSDPESNATDQWTDKYWDGKVNTYGAEWTNNKNIFSYPAQYVTQWPDKTTNSYWLLKNTDTTQYFKEVRTAIFSAYKSSIENQIKEQLKEQGQTVTDINLTEDDITQIKVTPYKISKNNDTKPDKHIDCTIDIVNDKVYTARFWVMEPGALKYEMKDSTTYLKEHSVSETSKARIGSTKTIGGVTYVLKGWYKENSDMSAADEPNSATTELITMWGYMPSEAELADGTVNFYAVYDRVNTDFTVKKEVTGWFGDKTKQFTFKIESADVSNVVTVKKNNEVVDANSFPLGDGETVTVSGIPADTIITVTETLNDAGYSTTASGFEQSAQTAEERTFRYKFVWETDGSGESGKFVLKPVDRDGNVIDDEIGSTTIVVQNEKKGEIDNGVLLDTLPYILILVVVVGGGVLLFLRKRKNDDDE